VDLLLISWFYAILLLAGLQNMVFSGATEALRTDTQLSVRDHYGVMRSFTTVIVVLTTSFGIFFFLFTLDGCFLMSETAECEDMVGMIETGLSLWSSVWM